MSEVEEKENKEETGSYNEIEMQSEDYDPYVHRKVAHPTNYMETFINMVKGCIGTGILAMPEAFKNSGLWNGLLSSFTISFFCILGLQVLFRAQHLICKKMRVPQIPLSQGMKFAMEQGPPCCRKCAFMAPFLVHFCILFNQYGVCCIYVLFVSSNIKAVVDEYKELDIEYYIISLCIPFMLINMIPNLKSLAKFSGVATMLSFFCYGSILYYMFRDAMPSISDRPSFGSPMTYPLYIGTFLFALEAPAVFIAIEQDMKQPLDFIKPCGIINVTFVMVGAIYAGLGFCGYWKYGDDVQSAVILNLPQERFSNCIKAIYATAIFCTYALHCIVPNNIVWEEFVYKLVKDKKNIILYDYLIRVSSVILTVTVALAVPFLGLVISLVGSLSLSTLGFVFPAIIDICINYPDNWRNRKFALFLDVFLFVFGILAFIIGTGCTVREIILAIIERYK